LNCNSSRAIDLCEVLAADITLEEQKTSGMSARMEREVILAIFALVQYAVVIFDAASFLPKRAGKRQLNTVCLQKEMKIV
jgi:hypothetical protein